MKRIKLFFLHNIQSKYYENKVVYNSNNDKYLDLVTELKKLWDMKVKVISVVVRIL